MSTDMNSKYSDIKKKVQSQVIQILNKTDYSLNVVNRYKENIIHASAANNCVDVIKCILQKHEKHCLERKNAFGWTPLMQAIRNENIEMVKFLLSSGVIVNDFSFLGMSVLSLASAISNEMFDLLYNNCPSALEYAAQDDINPLCIAALKNDKELFFKLIDLGLSVRNANDFTRVMIKQSLVPEISALAPLHLSSADYWNDLSDIEDLLKDEEEINITNNTDTLIIRSDGQNLKIENCIPKITVQTTETELTKKVSKQDTKNLHLKIQHIEMNNNENKHPISPTLSYLNESALPMTPNTFVTNDESGNTFSKFEFNINEKVNVSDNNSDSESSTTQEKDELLTSPMILKRCQNMRPPNLELRSSSEDSNITLSYTPQFSPSKTPNLPHDINEDNVFDESTPTPPKYKTPPRGIIIEPGVTKLMLVLRQFGLKRHIPTFFEQEIDYDLFLTLTDKDLIEIGFEKKSERLILVSVINECKGSKLV